MLLRTLIVVSLALATPAHAQTFSHMSVPCVSPTVAVMVYVHDSKAEIKLRAASILPPMPVYAEWMLVVDHPEKLEALYLLINGAGRTCDVLLSYKEPMS